MILESILLIGLLLGALADLKNRCIPNKLSMGLFIVTVLLVFSLESQTLWGDHFYALLWAILILIPLFYFKILGGGDIKLLLSTAFVVGLKALPLFFFILACVGGLQALFYKIFHPKTKGLPYVVSIAGGFLVFLLLKF